MFFNESPIEGNISQSKTQNEIDNMVSLIYQGKQVPDEFHKMISTFIRNKKTRKMMLNSMNQSRTKGMFTLNENSYKTIGDILIECLTVLQIERDFESIRLVINLSTTLYKTVPEAKRPRVFLNCYLEGHTIWRNEDFWKSLIKYAIIEEMHNQKNYNIYNKMKSFTSKVLSFLPTKETDACYHSTYNKRQVKINAPCYAHGYGQGSPYKNLSEYCCIDQFRNSLGTG